jgi:predicted MPP superfamily phosphohydrolase
LLGLVVRLLHLGGSAAWLATPNGIATLGGVSGLIAIGLALRGGLRTPAVREVKLPVGMPPSLAGLTIVQLSDVHIGPTLGADFLTAVVDRVNALNADLVAITGDLADGPLAETSPAMLPLRGLKARYGVVYVPGNHEYYHGGPAWFSFLSSLGVRVLRNQGLVLGEGDQRFFAAGVDDPTSRSMGGAGLDLTAALRERPAEMPTLLLSHQPLGFEAAAAQGVSLQLSGHTHGGQIFPFSLLVGLRYRFVAGLYRRGTSYLYVSRGTGYWGPPMRLGAASEITRLSFA